MLILASMSQTRAKMLQEYGIKFIQKPSSFDEDKLKIDDPKSFVFVAAKGKMDSAIKEFGSTNTIICADSLVSCNNKKLGKASNLQEAQEFLSMQSGNVTSVITCTILYKPNLYLLDLSIATYTFSKFDENDLNDYLKSNLWQGKAGAIMVEGFCKKYITQTSGLESTAMGMSLEKILSFL